MTVVHGADLDPSLRSTVNYCSDAVRVVLDAAATLGHNEGEPQVLALAVYGTVVELFSACVGLAGLGEPTAVPGILRSMFESQVDLDNLLHESGYIEHIYASGFEQTLKVMEASSVRQAFKDGRKAEYDELSAKLADLKCRGKGPLKIWQRCKRAGRLEEYEGLYGLFCIDAHNNTPALAERHISEKPDGGMLVSFFGPYDPWAVIRRLDVGLSLLFRAARDMHGAFQVPAPRVDALAAALDQMKANRVASQQNGT